MNPNLPTDTQALPELMTSREVAHLLGISASTLKRLRRNPAGPKWLRIAAGRKISYSKAAIHAYLAGVECR